MNSSTSHRKGTAFVAVLCALVFSLAACQKVPAPAGNVSHHPTSCRLVTVRIDAESSDAKHCVDVQWSPKTLLSRLADPPAQLRGTRFVQAR